MAYPTDVKRKDGSVAKRAGRPVGIKNNHHFEGLGLKEIKSMLKTLLPYTDKAVQIYITVMESEATSFKEKMSASDKIIDLLFSFQRELDRRAAEGDVEAAKMSEAIETMPQVVEMRKFRTTIPKSDE